MLQDHLHVPPTSAQDSSRFLAAINGKLAFADTLANCEDFGETATLDFQNPSPRITNLISARIFNETNTLIYFKVRRYNDEKNQRIEKALHGCTVDTLAELPRLT